MGCGAVLCCTALLCAVLCCAVLCCAVLCCAVLCCAVLCCAVLCCAVLTVHRVLHGVADGLLSKAELSLFLRSFLAALISMSQSTWITPVAELHQLLADTCERTAAAVFASDSSDAVSFAAFGNWYNRGGFDIIPWLELLDVQKWSRTCVLAALLACDAVCVLSTVPLRLS
jgi:hypothetical protein